MVSVVASRSYHAYGSRRSIILCQDGAPRDAYIEIAKLSGLKVTSVNQTLFGLKKSGHVKQAKERGSPFVLAKK